MARTPGKREREDDDDNGDGEQDSAPQSFLYGLFSTAKKKRRVESSTNSTQAPRTMPRLRNLSSPSSASLATTPSASTTAAGRGLSGSFAAQDSVTPPAPAAASRTDTATAPNLSAADTPMTAAAAASPWHGPPLPFSPNFSVGAGSATRSRSMPGNGSSTSAAPPLHRARRPYRPNSRFLITNYRPRASTRARRQGQANGGHPSQYDRDLAQRLLQNNHHVFTTSANAPRTRAITRRQLGSHQNQSRLAGSRLVESSQEPSTDTAIAAAAAASSERTVVRFDESQVAASTPHVARGTGNGSRRATPYRRAPSNDDNDADVDSPMQQDHHDDDKKETPPVYSDTARPLPVDYAALPRVPESADAPFVFDGATEFADDRPLTSRLVALFDEPSTLAITHIPRPNYASMPPAEPAPDYPPPEPELDSDEEMKRQEFNRSDESDGDDDENKNDKDKDGQPANKKPKVDLDIWKVDRPEGSWQCFVCSVWNEPGALVCASCKCKKGTPAQKLSDEEKGQPASGAATTGPAPAAAAAAPFAATAPAAAAARGSIGEGGFNFPGGVSGDTSSIGEGGFTFSGGAPSSSGGFAYVAPATTAAAAAPAPSAAAPAATPQSVSFGNASGGTGFTFGSGGAGGGASGSAIQLDDVSPKEQSSKKLRFSDAADSATDQQKPAADAGQAGNEESKVQDSQPSAPPAAVAAPAAVSTSGLFGSTNAQAPSQPPSSFSSGLFANSAWAAAAQASASSGEGTQNGNNATKGESQSATNVESKEDKDDPKTAPLLFGTQAAAQSEPRPAAPTGAPFGGTPAAGTADNGTNSAPMFAPAPDGNQPRVTFGFGGSTTTTAPTPAPPNTGSSQASIQSDSGTFSSAMGPPPNKSLDFGTSSSTQAPAAASTDSAPLPAPTFGGPAPASVAITPFAPSIDGSTAMAPPAANGSTNQLSMFGSSMPARAQAPMGEEDKKKKRRADDGDDTSRNAPTTPAFPFPSAARPTDMASSIQFSSATPTPSGDTSTTPSLFGSATPAPAPSASGQQTFSFGTGSTTTPVAPTPSTNTPLMGGHTMSNPVPPSQNGFGSQNGGSNVFGSTPAAHAGPIQFGASSTPSVQQPTSFNFGTANGTQNPQTFGTSGGAPSATSQPGFGFSSNSNTLVPQQSAPAPGAPINFGTTTPVPAPASTPGTGNGFGQQPTGAMFGGSAPPGAGTPWMPSGGGFSMGSTGGGFSIGSGGGGGGGGRASASRSGRRRVRAKYPPGTSRR